MDQHSVNSPFPGNGDDDALGPFQNNSTESCFFILHVFGSLSNGSNP
jgi:hypothetical protein